MSQPEGAIAPPKHRSFAALSNKGFPLFWLGSATAMMADNTEHVISYWVAFQKFNSPALGGFAVISHWLPFLLFSIKIGAIADRFDPRRFITIGMWLFVACSLSWGVLIATNSLQMWEAMTLLVVHGIAGVLWTPSSMLLLNDLVPRADLQSAVRLSATGRTLGVLLGPAVGSGLMLLLGPAHGIMVNALFYLPLLLWAFPFKRPFQTKPRSEAAPQRGFAEVAGTLRAIRQHPIILYMTLLIAASAAFIGSGYQAQMPAFANALGHGDPGLTYSMLLAADAAGALAAGIALEGLGLLRPRSGTAFVLGLFWCMALMGFALTHVYVVALGFLFLAGFVELAFNSMSQTLVQLNSPHELRGRIIGVYALASLGMRLFSGFTIGIVGGLIGIRWSLAGSAALLLVLFTSLLSASRRPPKAA